MSFEHYKAYLKKKTTISINFKGREYSVSAMLRDVDRCFAIGPLEFDQHRIAQIASRVSFYGDETDSDETDIFEQMAQAVRRAAFENTKEAAKGLYGEYKQLHRQLRHFHGRETPEFSEDIIKSMTIDNPADLQVFYFEASGMEQDVEQTAFDEAETEAREKAKALALRASTPLTRTVCHHGVRNRTLSRGSVHKNKSDGDGDPDSQESDRYEPFPSVTLSPVKAEQSNDLGVKRSWRMPCEGGLAA
jgi:hypothetical protein